MKQEEKERFEVDVEKGILFLNGASDGTVSNKMFEDGIRKFTPKECLNFMGFPQSFTFPDSIAESAMYMQAGNSVVVPMMTRVAQEIIKIFVNQDSNE